VTSISPLYVPTDIEIMDPNAAGVATLFYRFATPNAPQAQAACSNNGGNHAAAQLSS